jgi:hypothetical protein
VEKVNGKEAQIKFKVKAPLGGVVSKMVVSPQAGQNADERGAEEVIQAIHEGRDDDYDFKAVNTLFAGLTSPSEEVRRSIMPSVDSGVSLDALMASNPTSTITAGSNLDEFQSQAVVALVDNPTNTLFKFIHGPPGLHLLSK